MLFIKKHTFFQYWFTSRKGFYLTHLSPGGTAPRGTLWVRDSTSQKGPTGTLPLRHTPLRHTPWIKNLTSSSAKSFLPSGLRRASLSCEVSKVATRLASPLVSLNSLQPKPWYSYWLLPFVGFVMASPYGTAGIENRILTTTKETSLCRIRHAQYCREGLASQPPKFPLGSEQRKMSIPKNIALTTHFGPRKIQIISLARVLEHSAALTARATLLPPGLSGHSGEKTYNGTSASLGVGSFPHEVKKATPELRLQESPLRIYKTSKISFEQLYKKLLSATAQGDTVQLNAASEVSQPGSQHFQRTFRLSGRNSMLLRGIIEKVIPKLGQGPVARVSKEHFATLCGQSTCHLSRGGTARGSMSQKGPDGSYSRVALPINIQEIDQIIRSLRGELFATEGKCFEAATQQLGNKSTNTRFITSFNDSVFLHRYLINHRAARDPFAPRAKGQGLFGSNKRKQSELFNIRLNGPFLSSQRPRRGTNSCIKAPLPNGQSFENKCSNVSISPERSAKDPFAPRATGQYVVEQGFYRQGLKTTLRHAAWANNLPRVRNMRPSLYSTLNLSKTPNRQQYKPFPIEQQYTPLSEEKLLQANLTVALSRRYPATREFSATILPPGLSGQKPSLVNNGRTYSRNSILAQLKKESSPSVKNQPQKVAAVSSRNARNPQRLSVDPVDILRLKHFRLLRILEKSELTARATLRGHSMPDTFIPTTEFLFKDNDLLHENFLHETQKQKRRKKKRKRWTRRRRKRKRKLLRPLWIMSFLAHKHTKRTSHTADPFLQRQAKRSELILCGGSKQAQGSQRDSPPRCAGKSQSTTGEHFTLSLRKGKIYRFSKKELYGHLADSARHSDSLGAAPSNGMVQSIFEKARPLGAQLALRARRKMSLEVATYLRSSFSQVPWRVTARSFLPFGLRHNTSWESGSTIFPQSVAKKNKLNSKSERYEKRNFLNTLEYNRILAEKLRKNLRYTKIYTSPEDSSDRKVIKSTGIIVGQRNKIVHNEPKEEWVWLYKYISGELPSEPYLTEIDELRSIWALNKLQSTNQWTDWKNFYYQDFKKGVTARYEIWLEKKPDKRYNVNNLKKRTYKYAKNIERLRISAKLRRGPYFALWREVNKLRTLGIQSPEGPLRGKGSHRDSPFFSSEAIRKALKKKCREGPYGSKTTLPNARSRRDSPAQQKRHRMLHTKVPPCNVAEKWEDSIPIAHAIVDQYSTWWNCITNSSWGWKNIQYGAPWDRKTLYIPTPLTMKKKTESWVSSGRFRSRATLKSGHYAHAGLNLSHSPGGTAPRGTLWVRDSTSQKDGTWPLSRVESVNVNVQNPFFQIPMFQNGVLLSVTLLLHICIFLTLVSIPELRYTVKVNCIFIYKLTDVPIKLVSAVVEPFYTSLYIFQSFVLTMIGSRRESVLAARVPPLRYRGDSPPYFVGEKLWGVGRLYALRHSPGGTAPRGTLWVRDSTSQKRIKDEKGRYDPTIVLKTEGQDGHETLIENLIPICIYNTSLQIIKKRRRRLFQSHSLGKGSTFVQTESFAPRAKGVYKRSVGESLWDPAGLFRAQFEKQLFQTMLAIPFKGYNCILLGREQILDLFRDFILAIYDFFSLPENFSPNPDEMGLDILANMVYDFEEPFIELFPDIVDIQSEKFVKQFILPLAVFGPYGLFIQQRLAMFYRIFVELFYNADAENGKDQQESKILYTVWADLINKAADNFDTPSHDQGHASPISSQEELRVFLLEYLLTSNFVLDIPPARDNVTTRKPLPGQIMDRSSLFTAANMGQSFTAKSHNGDFFVDQYILHKTDETDLFFEINPPKCFSHLRAMKYYDMIQQPFGTLLCQIYSGIFIKQKAKNILLIGAKRSEKSLLVQSFAGETEMKLILDNSSRYATISQNVALGMRRLREVFEAISLQTPCIFVLEDIHLIGEKRPFLLSDEDLALVRNTNLGFEQYQPFEKNQNIQLYNRHRISNYKKPYRGDNPERLPTNMFCFDLFFHSMPKMKSIFPQAPIRLRPEGSFHLEIKNQSSEGETLRTFSALRAKAHSDSLVVENPKSRKSILSHIDSKRKGFLDSPSAPNHGTQIASPLKSNQIIHEKSSSFSTGLEVKQSSGESFQGLQNRTIQSKVSKLAEISLTNLSVKLDRITQFLVIMDNVRMNKGFIVFATTDKPQILDPALRRPGRLEETICLPTIPNILRKWENIQTQPQSVVKKRPYAAGYQRVSPLESHLFAPRAMGKKLWSVGVSTKSSYGTKKKNRATVLISTNYSSACKHLIRFFYEPAHFNSSPLGLYSPSHCEHNSSSDLNKNSHSLLFGTKKAFKLELITLFASCVANFFYCKKRICPLSPGGTARDSTSQSVAKGSPGTLPVVNQGVYKLGPHGVSIKYSGHSRLSWKTKSLDIVNDPKWTLASQFISAYIQKRAIWNKNKYVHKFLNIEKGSLVYFPSAPITTLLLPAKRFENFMRAEHDFAARDLLGQNGNLTKATKTLQEKIQFHTTQQVVKSLYGESLSRKQYCPQSVVPLLSVVKTDKITKKLKLRIPREPRNLGQSNYFSAQSAFATAGSLRDFPKTNHYYRNLFLKRHRNYLTNQWWNGHLTEYNIENTLMSEVDFRTCFIETQSTTLSNGLSSSLTKNKVTGDFLIDFPDADQYYNPIQQRWFSCNLQLTKASMPTECGGDSPSTPPSPYSWKTWFDLEKGLSSDIINHFVFETFSQTYSIFDQNRELIDHFVAKLSSKTKMQEIESLDNVRSILTVV